MKEIKDYLHMYLGCDCVVDGNKYFSGTPKNFDLKAIPATFDSINRNRNIRIEQWVGVTFKCGERGFEYYNCFNELCNCYTHFIHPDKIKPILRPLSSMTEDEIIGMKTQFENLITGGKIPNMICRDAQRTHYLLSKHFDLFGLIESGLAIDATTLTP